MIIEEVAMRIWMIGMLLFCMNFTAFAKTYDNLTPDQRKAFASDWLDTGKAYIAKHKSKNAKACFLYVNELYPIGKEAEEARTLLKENFKITINYNPDTQFKAYVKRADTLKNDNYRLNNILMALEIKEDKDALYKAAYLYNTLGDKEKSSEYLKKALDSGYPRDSVDPGLKDLIK